MSASVILIAGSQIRNLMGRFLTFLRLTVQTIGAMLLLVKGIQLLLALGALHSLNANWISFTLDLFTEDLIRIRYR